MEQTLYSTNIHWISQFKTIRPITIRATLMLVVILVTAILVVGTLVKQTDDHAVPDPFAGFAQFFPGQTLDTRVLVKQGFSCVVETLPTPADISEGCTQALSSGMFSDISLTIWDGVVQWLDLKVRDNDLNVGDLSLQWGSPQIRVEGDWVNLSWPKQHVMGMGWSPNGRFTYFQALSHITFVI